MASIELPILYSWRLCLHQEVCIGADSALSITGYSLDYEGDTAHNPQKNPSVVCKKLSLKKDRWGYYVVQFTRRVREL